jgi:glycosyltransferase involved in cell wall biosynthesis
MPRRSPVPVVVTLHDATQFTNPELHTPLKGRYLRATTRTALAQAARCVVPSEATRDELVRVLHADPGRIDVVPHGVDTERFHPPSRAEIARVRSDLGLDGDYVAFLGTHEPRKNLPALVRGWIAAVQGRPDAPALVLAGGKGWDRELDAAVAAVPDGLRVVRPGYLDIERLPGFLGAAAIVAYPSQGEGFGLPVLEAMACGAAVLTTRLLSLPEVGGDAVAYTAPDAAAISVALRALLDDPERRHALGAAGLQRSASFTWKASADAHLESYARAAGLS